MNWYNDGSHHVGWHSDSETDLLPGSSIASLSLGSTREFQLRHRKDAEKGKLQTFLHERLNKEEKERKKSGDQSAPPALTKEEEELLNYKVGVDPTLNRSINLSHGDLLIMRGQLQTHWRHRVPQLEKEQVGPRICFTFRSVASDFS